MSDDPFQEPHSRVTISRMSYVIVPLALIGAFAIGFQGAVWLFSPSPSPEYHLRTLAIGERILDLRSAPVPDAYTAETWDNVCAVLLKAFIFQTRQEARGDLGRLNEFGIRWPRDRLQPAKLDATMAQELLDDIEDLSVETDPQFESFDERLRESLADSAMPDAM